MNETITKLEALLNTGTAYFAEASEDEMSKRPLPTKWSKKEIIGHLIDSAVNNLQRFTEVQFEPKPYRIRNYKQAELVSANGYQHADMQEIADFWLSINARILNIMHQQTEESLQYAIIINSENTADLRFLMEDYVAHIEHHMRQITG